MARPLKKGWFSSYYGPATVNLNVTTSTGAQVIVSQTGTSTYSVGNNVHVTLVDDLANLVPAQGALLAGQCHLTHTAPDSTAKYVRKLTQNTAYYFDGTSALWNDAAGAVVGTFAPAPTDSTTDEPGVPPGTPPTPPAVVPATLGAIVVDETGGDNTPGTITSIAVTSGGANYVTPPNVVITGTNTTPATATATVEGGVVTAIVIAPGDGGTGYGGAAVTATLA